MRFTILLLISASLTIISAWPLQPDDKRQLQEESEGIANHKLKYWKGAVQSQDYGRLSKLATAVMDPILEAQSNTLKVFDQLEMLIRLFRRLADSKSMPFLRMKILKMMSSAIDRNEDHLTFYRLEAVKMWMDVRNDVTPVESKEWQDARINVVSAQKKYQEILDTMKQGIQVIRKETGRMFHFDEEKVRITAERAEVVLHGLKDDVLNEIELARSLLERFVTSLQDAAKSKVVQSTTTTSLA